MGTATTPPLCRICAACFSSRGWALEPELTWERRQGPWRLSVSGSAILADRKLADTYWATEVAGSNSFWQRAKRLVFRVPHYKTGEELAALVAAAKANRP